MVIVAAQVPIEARSTYFRPIVILGRNHNIVSLSNESTPQTAPRTAICAVLAHR